MSVHADPPPAIVREPKGFSYQTGGQLGKGGFAICHSAEAFENGRGTGKIVALKIVRSQMEPPKLAQKFVTELQLHSKLSHGNIVEFYRAFSYAENTYVVLELCSNGSLADALRKRKFFTMPEIRRFVIQTCGAVKYLHHRNIIHRDLKTGNLFLDHNMNVKVGDFGLAAMLVSKNDMGARRTTMCGTPNYLAPEILEKGGKGHNEKVDLWAIGIIAYTLAVGKAPFHAAKREEIYKKLQNREYAWPDPSKHTNEISNDLRDLVSSLLVEEDDRPSPDHIVSHAFFKMAFIPDTLDASATLTKPSWAIRLPTAETIQRGYSESWYKMCKASGVGEYAPGRMFPLGQGKRIPSVVRDVEREIQAGKAPIVPIPADVVYLPYPETANFLQPAPSSKYLSEIVEERESSSDCRLTEVSGNRRSRPKPQLQPIVEKPTLKENLRVVGSERVEPALAEGGVKGMGSRRRKADEPATAVPARSKSTIKQLAASVGSTPDLAIRSVAPQAKAIPTAEPIKAMSSQPVRRARSTRIDSAMQKFEPTRETRKVTPPAAAPVPVVHSAVDTAKRISRTLSRSSKPTESREVRAQKSVPNLSLSSRPMTVTTEPTRSQASVPPYIPSTSPEQVLERAMQLRDNIALAMRGRGRQTIPDTSELPFITKWVDYSRKLGIGYVLQDGSIGCILNKTTKHPLTHVVVRNGIHALQARQPGASEKEPEVPLEIYEADAKGLKSVQADDSRKKLICAIWIKFARYMCQQLGHEETPSDQKTPATPANPEITPFVRFYERIDSVGIWGFSNNTFQLNFPDHTKLVIGADGGLISFTCLPLAATSRIEAGEGADLPYRYIKGRLVLQAPTVDLLHKKVETVGSRRAGVATRDVEIASANALAEKLAFFVKVLEEWKAEGGLGCGAESAEVLTWRGMRLEESKKTKSDWVLIGPVRVS